MKNLLIKNVGGCALAARGGRWIHPALLARAGRILFVMAAAWVLWLPARAAASGVWTALANPPPSWAGHFLLLPDGTVMAEDLTTNYGPGWFRLTPDIHGNYANGTWSRIAPMSCVRLDFSSVVLTNGDVFVASGEYGPGTTNAEIYDPESDTWRELAIPPGVITTDNVPYSDGQNDAGFSDCNAILLRDGRVLMSPVFPAVAGHTAVYDPASDSWTTPKLVRGYDEDEATMLELPDDSILVIDSSWPSGIPSTNSERFLPGPSQWRNDSNVPVSLYDDFGLELGPAMLLPNGNGIFFGATTHTAIYTPSGTTNAGSWVAGPDFPNGQGMPDAPAAMLANGKVLCVVEQAATNDLEWYPPISFCEYDYVSNSFSQVSAPGGGTTFDDYCYDTLLLNLPDGTALFGHRSMDFYTYQPDGVPLAAAQPAIQSIRTNADGTLHLTGTLFTGLCQGASYGDDEQMDSNFPLVRFTDASGQVRYGRTFNWSRGGVMTGTNIETTECAVPAGAGGSNTVQVVVNGIASAGVPLVLPAAYAVTDTADGGAGSLRQAIATSIAGATINFAPYLSGATIRLTSGELDLMGNVTIDASGLPEGVRVDGNYASRIFNIAGGVTAVMNALTLTNGHSDANDWGGAILNDGTLTLSNCTLAGNFIDGGGSGGAIENAGGLTAMGCTFSGNGAGYAGAIRNESTGALVNCTFYSNSVPGNGGAIDNVFGASLNLLHCTLSANSAGGDGAGIENYLSTMTVTNCIVAGNAPDDIYNWGSSTVTAGGSNIVESLPNDGTLNGADFVIDADPLLAAPGNYGGLTQTMPPLPGSPAVDSAVATGLAIDQRGIPRPLGLAPDIGAVEGIYNPAGAGRLTGATRTGNGAFQFAFTNYPGASFTVLASTNVALPLELWSIAGPAVETPPGSGRFVFTDPGATNSATRFYRVREP